MKLNPDCIRALLLTIEKISDRDNDVRFKEENHHELLSAFTFDEIQYHIEQCEMSNLIVDVKENINGEIIVKDLSPKGHEFIANIREDTTWNKIKNNFKKVGSGSLTVLTQIASAVIADIAKAQIGLS